MEQSVSIPTDFHIDSVPGAIAKQARQYPVPMIYLHAFKKELLHLVEIGVILPQGASERVSPMFITTKKRWQSLLG
jgi:hypothetical protein